MGGWGRVGEEEGIVCVEGVEVRAVGWCCGMMLS